MAITYTVIGTNNDYVTVQFFNDAGQIYVRTIRADPTAENFSEIMQSYVDMISERVTRGMIQFTDA